MLIATTSSRIAVPKHTLSSSVPLYNIRCHLLSTSARASGSEFRRSDFQGQPFTGTYEPDQPTRGPLAGSAKTGVPRVTPKLLKEHLDKFVIGQDRPKKVLSVAVYNHYQRIQELQRQHEEELERAAKADRRMMFESHPVETDYPGQVPTVNMKAPIEEETPESRLHAALSDDAAATSTIEKSNILMLGPSGVGKTLMVKTLARVLDVPFSMSDCTPFTQAGYIGEDADLCVQRLFAAADYDVARTENGIICLDEFDKIATSKVSHGKDVSGEGVQQALLKLIEGTTIQITAKADKAASKGSAGGFGMGNGLSSATGGQPKTETYNIRTDNILFICTGAFVNLQKMVMDRVAKGSLGFGAPVRAPSLAGHDVIEKPDPELFKKHMPFWSSNPSTEIYNPLDLVEPADLQKYGMIPELIGRIPITTALSKLDLKALVRVLVEPRNSLVQQFIALFQTYGIELRFTSPALHSIAEQAVNMGTGARGLRKVMENVTFYAMYHGPGSSVKHVLITKDVAQMKSEPVMLARGQAHRFHAMIAHEEEEWEKEREDTLAAESAESHNFEEFREQAKSGM